MNKEEVFYSIFLGTIIVIRLLVFVIPEVEIRVGLLIIHHFWFGVIFLLMGLARPKLRLYLIAVGLALMVDQFSFLLFGSGMDKEYWSIPSVDGVILLASLFFLLKKKLVEALATPS